MADADPSVRSGVAPLLGRRQERQATEALVRALTDPDGAVRGPAAQALAGHPGEDVTEALIALTSELDPDPDPEVPGAAALALRGRPSQRVTLPYCCVSCGRVIPSSVGMLRKL
jgi:HEAT repeat protein